MVRSSTSSKFPASSLPCKQFAPYLTLFLNGTGWSPTFPRLVSNEQLAIALTRAQTVGKARFTNIGDISCDVEVRTTISTLLARPQTVTHP
jgi:alpha-aminoadipic semialdehyde synthase